ncbi:MAG: hypothetical protein ACI8X5_000564 [Planctomycetota bacterium]|jgi:hypothetical protein
MSNTKLLSTLFLAAPIALFAAGCSGDSAGTGTSTESANTSDAGHDDDAAHDHAGHDHADGDDHAHGGDEGALTNVHEMNEELEKASNDIKQAPAGEKLDVVKAVDDHAGHDHAPGEHDEAPTGAINNPPLGDGQGPRLVYRIGEENHKFGRVMQGTVAEHTFELSNDGTEDLIIKQVKPTCGCTVAAVQWEDETGVVVDYTFGDPIPPGRRVHFPAKLHTKNKSGHQTTRVNVFSNDPRGTIQLGLEADIDPFFNIAPRFLNFGQISVGDVVEKKAVISTSKGTPVGLSMVEQSLPQGTVADLVPINPDSEGRAARWELSVSLGPDLIEGNLARAISLTGDEEIPGSDVTVDGAASKYQATITLSAQVVGPFSFNPPYLSMGLVRPGQVATRTVTIESHDPDFSFADSVPVVKIVGLQDPAANPGGETTYREWEYADRFTPTIRPVEGKNAVEIELRLEGMPDNATGSFRGTLVIELAHEDKPEISLVITGVCRGGPSKK